MRFDSIQRVRFFGELTGTAMIVGLGCMGCIESGSPPIALLQTGLVFGLVTMVVKQVFGFISGGHANPCVTLCCFLLGHLPWDITAMYIFAQFLGAILGYGMLTLLLPSNLVTEKDQGLCMSIPNKDISEEQAFSIEFVLTCVLIFGWCALWDVRNSSFLDSVALRVGLLVTCLIMSGSTFTGASMNPARTFAPAFFMQNYEYLWIYFGSQFSAAILIPYLWKYLYTPRITSTT